MDSKLGAPMIWSKYAEHLARRNQLAVVKICYFYRSKKQMQRNPRDNSEFLLHHKCNNHLLLQVTGRLCHGNVCVCLFSICGGICFILFSLSVCQRLAPAHSNVIFIWIHRSKHIACMRLTWSYSRWHFVYMLFFSVFFSVGVGSMCIYETLWLKARDITTLISSLFHLPPGQDSVKFSDTGQESRLRSLDTVCFERISICELAARVMDKTLWNVFNAGSCITTTCLALQCGVSCSHKFQTEI